MSFDFLSRRLAERAKAKLLRERRAVSTNKDGIIEVAGKHYLNFASNDYLGLSQHEQVLQSYVEGLAMHGSGSGASSVVTGYSIEHEALENDLCEVLNKPAAILFSSGFAANQALCHALDPTAPKSKNHSVNISAISASQNNSQAQLTIVCDKLMHASFIQGALDIQAKLKRFKHNDLDHAAKLMLASTQNTLVATEGIFSMDGDAGDVRGLQALIEQQAYLSADRPWLMVDDAHAIGVLGENGFGTLDTKDVNSENVDIVMGTFGKAMGTSGAFVAGSYELIEYLVNFSKHYVYSTAFSAAQARATRASIALIAAGAEREKLHTNIAQFVELSQAAGLPTLASSSAIHALVIGEPEKTLRISERLRDLGLWVPAIRTPTVPANSDRLRITLSALHSEQDIRVLVDALCLSYEELADAGPSSPEHSQTDGDA